MKDGLSEEARELAVAALSALSDRKLEVVVEGQKHVMLSCEFGPECTAARLFLASDGNDSSLKFYREAHGRCLVQTNGMCKPRYSG